MEQIPQINYNSVRNYDQLFHICVMTVTGGRLRYYKLRPSGGGIDWVAGPEQDSSVPHRHEFYELVYVHDGVLTQHMGESVSRLQAGDAMLLNCGVHHYEDTVTDCRVAFLSLYPQLLQEAFGGNVLFPGRPQYPAGGIPTFVSSHGGQNDVRAYLDFSYAMERRQQGQISPVSTLLLQLIDAVCAQRPGYAYQAQALLLQALAALEDPALYHLSQINVDATTEEVLFARVMHYLSERQGQVSRAELGQAMHYNGDYLNRVVKNACGKTIHELSQELRLQAAGRLLRQTQLPVGTVIEQLGFHSRTHFYRLFRERMGCSPLDYRREAHRRKN